MLRNVELKALDPEPARTLAACFELGAEDCGTLRQRDTYFNVPSGRLKLREQEPPPSQLVWYERADAAQERESRYRLAAVDDPTGLVTLLEAALGIRVVVEKERRLFLWQSVRIHLDRVERLGSFVELEAVAPPGSDLAAEHGPVRKLRDVLAIDDGRLVATGYADCSPAATRREQLPRSAAEVPGTACFARPSRTARITAGSATPQLGSPRAQRACEALGTRSRAFAKVPGTGSTWFRSATPNCSAGAAPAVRCPANVLESRTSGDQRNLLGVLDPAADLHARGTWQARWVPCRPASKTMGRTQAPCVLVLVQHMGAEEQTGSSTAAAYRSPSAPGHGTRQRLLWMMDRKFDREPWHHWLAAGG